MSEKEMPPNGGKTKFIVPVVAVAAFLLGFAVFGLIGGNRGSDGNRESVPSAEEIADAQQRTEGVSSEKDRVGELPNALPDDEMNGAVNAELEALAEKHNISVGKASLIQEVIAQKPGLTFETLAPMTINEIAQIISDDTSSGGLSGASDQIDGNTQQSAPESLAGNNAEGALPRTDGSVSGAAGSTDYIGEAAAKEAALTDAGIKENATSYMSCYIDYDDGRAEHYKVEFITGNTEYEYEIDLHLGTVLEKSMDTININNNHNSHGQMAGNSYIGEEAAWEAALNHAGLKEDEVTRKKVKLDEDDGIMVYEVEFLMGRTEYDYEIHAVSGEVLKAETDKN